MALALPIDVPDRNIFVSFNFEANYALPTESTDFTQGLYDKILLIDKVTDEEPEVNKDDEEEFEARKLESLNFFSRKHVYRMMEEKMENYGINGHGCLLRLICEVAGSEMIKTNGVFGNLVHILLT